MKTLKITPNDRITVNHATNKRNGQQIVYVSATYDVIKINKKSVILQKYPTNERLKLKVSK